MIEKIKLGDIKAFEWLFNEYYERLSYYAYQYLKDKDSAENVVQELFSKIWIGRQKLSSDIRLAAYLYTAVRNACLNQIKHQKVKEAHIQRTEHFSHSVDSNSNKIDVDDLNKIIQSSIFNLPPERQKIFLLSREDGLKYQEIADKLGISVKTVETQMGKALRFLRERLKDYLVVLLALLINLQNLIQL